MTAGLVTHWLESGRLELPLPASGRTAERWQGLALLAEDDVVAARIAEAHVDAVAILDELGGKPPEPSQLWGVWAAESSDAVLTATNMGGGAFTLSGTKVWCSGAGFCTHGLVTAGLEDGSLGLFAAPVIDPAVKALPTTWWNAGMAGSDTRPVQFTNAHAVAVGHPGDYLDRPGFWHRAIGVAACWLGGARRLPNRYIAAPEANQRTRTRWLTWAPWTRHLPPAMRRFPPQQPTSTPIRSTGPTELNYWPAARAASWNTRPTKPSPALAAPWDRARCVRTAGTLQRVADLTIYIRQSHAERDLAELGPLAGRQC